MRNTRNLTKLLAMLLVGVLLFGCSGGGAGTDAGTTGDPPAAGGTTDSGDAVAVGDDEEVHITMFIWAGANQDVVPREVGDQYMADHPNVKIEYYESNNALTYPKMLAAKQATPDEPLVNIGFFNSSTIAKGHIDDMWIDLDPEGIPNMNLVPQDYWYEGGEGIGYYDTPIGLLYNTEHITEPPTSWNEMIDPKNEGKVSYWDYMWYGQIALAYANGGSEKDIDKGFDAMIDNVDNIHSFYTSNDQIKNLLVAGDAWMTPWFSGISLTWMNEGTPLGWVEPVEGTLAFPAYLAIVDGSTPAQVKVCEDLVNLLLEPENNGRYNALTGNLPTVEGAIDFLPDDVKSSPLMDPKLLENTHFLDWNYIAQQDDEWSERLDKEVKAIMK